jgi:Prephenate dehydratase
VHYHSQDTISGLYSLQLWQRKKRVFYPEFAQILRAAIILRTDAFHGVVGPSGDVTTLALLPQENSIFGIVTETYDLLRSSELGENKWIRGAVTLSVQHCLIVRRGKTMRDIKKVLSHEQVRKFFGFVTEVVRLNLTPLDRRDW